jgi:hypothetical protein
MSNAQSIAINISGQRKKLRLGESTVNDAVVIDNTTPLAFSTREDTSFTITQAELLANATITITNNIIIG